MAKRKFGKFVALATVSGVIAAGISYFLKYKSFHDELEEDFHDFEGDDEFDGELPHELENAERSYVSLNEKKEDLAETVKEAAHNAADAAAQQAGEVKEAVKNAAGEMSEMVKEAVKDTAEAVKNAEDEISATIEEIDEDNVGF